MTHYPTPRKIPSLLVFGILIGTFFAISWMARNGIIFTGQAAPGDEPQDVRITNITDTSFSVAYTTQDVVLGAIKYGNTDNPDTPVLDVRDQESNNPSPRTTHFFTVSNLSPETKYFFTISSGGTTYKDGEQAFTLTTGSVLAEKSSETREVTGSVKNPDGTIPKEALVTLVLPDASPVTAVVQSDGTYAISLAAIRTLDGKAHKTITDQETMLLYFSGTGGVSTVTATSATLSIPPVTLSETYDFTLGETPQASGSAEVTFSDFPEVFSDESETGEGPKILVPQANEAFRDPRPSFSGTALPRESVAITLSSQAPTSVTANANGEWEYRPDEALTPGNQTITIKTDDASGTERTITQSFTIFAEGTQFLDPSVSPSQTTITVTVTATPTVTRAPSVTTTPGTVTSTLTPTVSPTLSISVSPTVIPTATLTPTSTPLPTATISRPPPPVSGSEDALGIGLAAISAIIVGSLLFFMTKGSTTF